MTGPELITLGCRLNFAESAAMRALAAGEDDLVIVNSCAVTAEAVRQARQAIRRAKRDRPEARIVVTGCAAQIDPEAFAQMPEVSRVVGNVEKHLRSSFRSPQPVRAEPVEALSFLFPAKAERKALRQARGERNWGVAAAQVHVSDIMAARGPAPSPVDSERTRAFVAVQTGCDHRCTFCIIPYGRGNSRSAPAGAVVERIKALVANGIREVVLTGVDVASYGPDLPGSPSLGRLIERILRHVPDLARLRLSSLDSVEIDEHMFDLVTGEPRVMPHLHLSLQAGDDMILKRMKRRHSRGQAVELVARLKAARPEIAIGADLIAGFPTEDGAMAANSLALVEDCDIVFAHVFPYSPRPGTPAARMPQVAPEIAKARAKALREASARRKAAWLTGLVGSTQRVLVERNGQTGYAGNFARVAVDWLPAVPSEVEGRPTDRTDERVSTSLDTAAVAGRVLDLRITASHGDTLIGVPA